MERYGDRIDGFWKLDPDLQVKYLALHRLRRRPVQARFSMLQPASLYDIVTALHDVDDRYRWEEHQRSRVRTSAPSTPGARQPTDDELKAQWVQSGMPASEVAFWFSPD